MNATLETIAKAICQANGLDYMGQVGEGTFKETYHVLNNGFSEALKVFRQDNSSERTNREIEAMVCCDHNNIGKLRHVGEFDDSSNKYIFTIEEYLRGGTLTKRLSQGLLSTDELSRMGAQLIDAISHIANLELVHRDIKPDNILFKEEDRITPVIVDFGIVRNIRDQSLTHSWLAQGPGSPYFAAPEQLNNQKHLIDWRTDQFALGVVFSLSIFGIHPYAWPGDSSSSVVVRVAERHPLSDQFIKCCKNNNLELIMQMVSQWPIERIRTPQELAEGWAITFNPGGKV